MFEINKIWHWLFILFFVALISISYASATTDLFGEYAEDLSLPDYGPEIFEKAANSPGFVAVKGIMPVITDEGEKRDWTDLLVHCSRANNKIDNYFVSSGGPVSSFGTYIDGYLKVGLDSATPERVNDSVLDEIYHTIDEAAKEEGVNDVPVVFMWEHEEVIEMADSTLVSNDEAVTIKDETGNYVIKENSTTSGTSESKTQTISGFTSIMLILCLLVMSRFTK